MIYNSLSIAGSDSGGGAGIQADLKTFSALGNYGASVITALTAQNTQGCQSYLATQAEFVSAQIESVLSDIRIDSAKIGMLANSQIIRAVAKDLERFKIPFLLLDTVMIAKGGHALLEDSAIDCLRDELIPLADLITPNLPEAAALLACDVAQNEQQMREQGRELLKLGCPAVLIKGGHLSGEQSPDWLICSEQEICLPATRIKTRHSHGTGCTLSAAITALQPRLGLVEAIREAKIYLTGALASADKLQVGKGIGPTHHFYRIW